ncbi:QacE family quaternary ammonium compound efflux SMR transporter [Mucilaginibacter hurinus]|uniref:Guanidinium exporter n=1 Tax=Mucilaginibacter hurinus TaxID=2201324 RepID=A0A367GNP7_9SPHI|nr:multidrug efflux SMR transporter [Mucilaginibacter hurinus]RCH55089.1 QacE family quaternary ammonium compound efflux SMR transporter [Mucilaginibacter hurinus]
MHWILLIIAGIFEVGFTTSLKLSEGFSNWKWAASFVACVIISFILLTKATAKIPLGTAYAIWSGIGAVGTVLVGIYYFEEDANFWRLFFIGTLILSIVGLKLVTTDAKDDPGKPETTTVIN